MTRDAFDRFQPPERGRFGDNEQAPAARRARVTGRSDLVDLTLRLHLDDPRKRAIAVSDPAKPGQKWIWLARSQVEYREINHGTAEVTLPQWLAAEKGLI